MISFRFLPSARGAHLRDRRQHARFTLAHADDHLNRKPTALSHLEPGFYRDHQLAGCTAPVGGYSSPCSSWNSQDLQDSPLESPVADDRLHTISCSDGIFVFPDPDNCPAGLGQQGIGCAVAPHVGVEFVAPPVRIGLGEGLVFGASVPEASVHKNSDPGPSEDDIGPGSPDLWEGDVYTVSEPPPVEFPPDC